MKGMSIEEMEIHLQKLSIEIGERHLGSAGEARTQDYLATQFAALGYTVIREPFTAPGWQCRSWRLSDADKRSISCYPCFYSPAGVAKAVLKQLWQEEFDREDLSAFRGKIAFAANYAFESVGDTNRLAMRLEQAGAAGLVITSPYNDTWSTKIVRNPELKTMPVVTLSRRSALRLAPSIGRTIELEVDASTFEHRSCNVVARYQPEGQSRGKLVFGAHYDTAPGIPGAADNGSGLIQLLALAKALHGELGDWEVDFVAFGGEEFGGPGYGIGAYSYLTETHSNEIPRIQAMFCLDDIGTYLTRPEARIGHSRKLRRIVKELATETGIQPAPYRAGSDQGIFHQHGIPTLWLFDGGAETGVRHFPLHSPQDTIDLIHWNQVERIAQGLVRIVQTVLREGLDDTAQAPIQIIPLEQSDHPKAEALVRQVWSMGMSKRREDHYGGILGNKPWQDRIAASLQEALANRDCTAFQATVDGEFAGFMCAEHNRDLDIGIIGYNAVVPERSGRGIGQQLLQHCIQFLRDQGVRHIEVTTGLDEGHAPARAMYVSAGFKPLHTSILYTMEV